MKKNSYQTKLARRSCACAIAAGAIVVMGNTGAGTATGNATATVVQPVSVRRMSAPEPVAPAPATTTAPATVPVQESSTRDALPDLSTSVTLQSIIGRVSASAPLLRSGLPAAAGDAGSASVPGADATATPFGSPDSTGADSATVTVNVDANGAIQVSGGSNGPAFAVSQTGESETILVEYN